MQCSTNFSLSLLRLNLIIIRRAGVASVGRPLISSVKYPASGLSSVQTAHQWDLGSTNGNTPRDRLAGFLCTFRNGTDYRNEYQPRIVESIVYQRIRDIGRLPDILPGSIRAERQWRIKKLALSPGFLKGTIIIRSLTRSNGSYAPWKAPNRSHAVQFPKQCESHNDVTLYLDLAGTSTGTSKDSIQCHPSSSLCCTDPNPPQIPSCRHNLLEEISPHSCPFFHVLPVQAREKLAI